MKVDRLLQLADHLESLPVGPKLLYKQELWGVMEFKPSTLKLKNGNTKCEVEEGFCKTSACALGHAALMPEFNRLGLKVEWTADEYDPNKFTASIKLRGLNGPYVDEFDVAQKFFGLNEETATTLFGSNQSSPKVKAKQIRRVVDAFQRSKAGK